MCVCVCASAAEAGGGSHFGGGGAAQFGSTALIYAARDGHADCARLLLDAGADKEAKNNVRARVRRGWGG